MEYEFKYKLPSNCPPYDSKSIDGYFFRFTVNNPPQDDDFLCYAEKKNINSTKCEHYALSIISSIEGIIKLQKRYPFFRNKCFIVKGRIKKNSGVIMHTPSRSSNEHYSWWLYKDTNTLEIFKVVHMEEVKK